MSNLELNSGIAKIAQIGLADEDFGTKKLKNILLSEIEAKKSLQRKRPRSGDDLKNYHMYEKMAEVSALLDGCLADKYKK